MSVTRRVQNTVLAAANRTIGVDGIARSKDAEEELNRLALATFREANAQQFLTYLRSITINSLLGPGASNDEMRHMEGQRYLVALIERRVEHGRRIAGK